MRTERLTVTVSPEIGDVSARFIAPEQPRCLLVLAHGAGAGMNHVFMEQLAEALAAVDIATLRFNFPFAEHGKRRPDTPPVAQRTIAAAIARAQDLAPALPLFLAGKSFGGRMGSQYLAAHSATAIQGLVLFGFPLHPDGKPATERADHLGAVAQPLLFLQGTRDKLATWALIEAVCAALPRATLVRFEGADHGFKAGKQAVIPALAQATADWVRHTLR